MSHDQIEWVRFIVPTALNTITIVVLVFTWLAANAQAKAAHKLTEATDEQIKASKASANAAKEQVEVARRQITESLRPILTFRTPSLSGHGEIKNEGAGVALNIWWTYGRIDNPGCEQFETTRKFLPAGAALPLTYDRFRFDAKGLLIFYRSLSGIVSVTAVTGTWSQPEYDYVPDVECLQDLPAWGPPTATGASPFQRG